MNVSEPNGASSRPLHEMFTAVPPRYDLINHIITLGMDTRWRRLAVTTCLEGNPQKILDIGCGTGDLTVTIARNAEPPATVTGLDYSEPMLEIARRKAAHLGVAPRVEFISGNAASLPFTDGHFDRVCISFAFRNLTFKNPLGPAHLSEVHRVLKTGGQYVIVESSQPLNRFIRACHHAYLKVFVGPVGQLISGNRGAYRYLAESARQFYMPDEVRAMLVNAGFTSVHYRPLFFGAAGIHLAEK